MLGALGGTGLPGDVERREARGFTGAAFDHAAQQAAHRARRLLRHHAADDGALVAIEHGAVSPANLLHDRRLHQLAAVRDRGVCIRELQRRHVQCVAHRERGGRLLVPALRRGKAAALLGGIRQSGRRPEPDVAQQFVLLARRKPHRELHDPDVARKTDHVGERETCRRMIVLDLAAVEFERAVVGVHHLVHPRAVEVEEARDDEGLERGARLVHLGERGRGRRERIGAAAGHRAHFAAIGVEHDYIPTRRAGLVHGVAECFFSDILQRLVHGQHDRATRFCVVGTERGRVEARTLGVAEEGCVARLAAQHRVERLLQPVDRFAGIVDAADQAAQAVVRGRHAFEHGLRVDAAHRDGRRDIAHQESAGDRHPDAGRVGRARHPLW